MRQVSAGRVPRPTTLGSDRSSKDSDGIPVNGDDRNSLRSCTSSNSNLEVKIIFFLI